MQRAYQNLSSRMVHKQITSIQVLRWTIPTYLHLQAVWFDVWNQRWSLQPYGQKSQEVQAIKSAYIPICDGLVSAGDDKLIWINNMESIGSCGRQAKLILVARNEIDLGDSRPRLRGGRGGHQAGGFGHSVPGQAPHWGFHLLNLQQSVQGLLRWHGKCHLDSKHFPSEYGHSCRVCGYHCKSKAALAGHVSIYHRNRWKHYVGFNCSLGLVSFRRPQAAVSVHC